MSDTIQYILIGTLFILAVYYLYGRFLPFGKKKKAGGCGKGCDCPVQDNTSSKTA